MKLKEGLKNKLLFFIFIPILGYCKIDLFSLREKEEEAKPVFEERKIEEPTMIKPKEPTRIKPKEPTRTIRPKIKREALPKEEAKVEKLVKEKLEEIEIEETMPFKIKEEEEFKEEEKPLWLIFSLAATSFCGIIIIGLIFFNLTKKEKIYRPLSVPPSDIEEEIKNLKQSSKIVSSQLEDIEKTFPKEFIEALKSGKVFSQIVKDILVSIEPRIKELGLAYQAIKKSIVQLDSEIHELSSLKALNFRDLARQTSTEFIIPLKNEFEKAKLSYENLLYSFEERQNGRFSSIEKKYIEVKESMDEIYKRLLGLESIVTSITMFEQEPIIRPKKKEVIPPLQKERSEINKLIYKLADSGLSVDEIAKKTKIGKGEISLILSLRKKA